MAGERMFADIDVPLPLRTRCRRFGGCEFRLMLFAGFVFTQVALRIKTVVEEFQRVAHTNRAPSRIVEDTGHTGYGTQGIQLFVIADNGTAVQDHLQFIVEILMPFLYVLFFR